MFTLLEADAYFRRKATAARNPASAPSRNRERGVGTTHNSSMHVSHEHGRHYLDAGISPANIKDSARHKSLLPDQVRQAVRSGLI